MIRLRYLATIAAGGLIAAAMSGAAQAGPLLDMTGGWSHGWSDGAVWSHMIAGPLTMAALIALVLAAVVLASRPRPVMAPVRAPVMARRRTRLRDQ
jgi:hypothetical protein